MTQMVVAAVVVGLFGAVMGALVRLGARVRRRGGGSSDAVIGPFEEIWHPAAHGARQATQAVEERVVPMPSPDDLTPRRIDR